MQQLAIQVANQGGDANQAITQVAQQVAENPQGPVSQSIAQIAKQQTTAGPGPANQAITQIAQQQAPTGGAVPITQVLVQLLSK